MNSSDLIRVLREVPECRLRLIELAQKVLKDDGSLDWEQLAFRQKELQEAISEAQAYVSMTGEAVQCLRGMGRSWS